MIRGSPKFDGLALGEIHVNFLRPTVEMRAKAAFIDTQSGATCGWTEGTQWSPETIKKLDELRTMLERDLASIYFTGDARAVATSNPAAGAARQGLGEHLDEDAPPA